MSISSKTLTYVQSFSSWPLDVSCCQIQILRFIINIAINYAVESTAYSYPPNAISASTPGLCNILANPNQNHDLECSAPFVKQKACLVQCIKDLFYFCIFSFKEFKERRGILVRKYRLWAKIYHISGFQVSGKKQKSWSLKPHIIRIDFRVRLGYMNNSPTESSSPDPRGEKFCGWMRPLEQQSSIPCESSRPF